MLNDQDTRPYEVVSDLDRTQRRSSSGIWELPFGKGRHWGTRWNPVLEGIAGGWQLSGVMQYQSGAPLGFGNVIFNGDHNNVLLPKGQRNVNADFERNQALQLANNLRRFPIRCKGISGPIQARWGFGAIKNFAITERWKLQFRAETQIEPQHHRHLRSLRHHHRTRPAPLLARRFKTDLLNDC